MEVQHYHDEAQKVDRGDYNELAKKLSDPRLIRIFHGALGVGTEAGELQDAIKKHIFYDKPLNVENIVEEVGDILWYCTILLDELGYTLEDSMKHNDEKLKKRYAGGYSNEKAVARADKIEESLKEDRGFCAGIYECSSILVERFEGEIRDLVESDSPDTYTIRRLRDTINLLTMDMNSRDAVALSKVNKLKPTPEPSEGEKMKKGNGDE